MTLHHLMLFVHLAGVIVWVGGMSFAHFCLRPASLALPPPQRLALAAIVGSGFAMLLAVGFAQAPLAWHAMAGIGLVMAAIFASIWFGPWKALQQAVALESWAQGAQALNQIRQRVTTNLLLGAFVVALASLGLAI
jgi:uncharacterized membrane protein